MRLFMLFAPLIALLAACSPTAIFNGAISSKGFVLTRDVAYGPGPRRTLDIYVPRDLTQPAPVVVFFYGGGWDGGRKEMYKLAGEALSSRGFVVVIPDYRLYPQVKFPDFLDDCAAAVAWTAGHVAAYGGRPDAISLMGHSAGAYNAAMLALDPHYLAARGFDRARIRAVVGLSGPYDFYPFDVAASRQTFGEYPRPELTQPVHFVTAKAPPMLLLQGAADRTVYPRNSRNLAAKLRQAGSEVSLKTYPGMGHAEIVLALAAPIRQGKPVLDDSVDFLQAHLPPVRAMVSKE